MIVGFWKRFLSDMIDVVILGLIGFSIIFLFQPLIAPLGENALWLGLCIIFLYTGILQSKIGHGQSLGKKILKIQVLKTDGTYLSIAKSFLRYSIVALVYYNNWILGLLASLIPVLSHPIAQLIALVIACVCFFGVTVFLALHPQKKGLQDLVADSVVVLKGTYSAEKIKELNSAPKTTRAYVIWGLCSALLACGCVILATKVMVKQPTLNEFLILRQNIMAETKLSNVAINYTGEYAPGARWQTIVPKTLFMSGFLRKPIIDPKTFGLEEAKQSAKRIAITYSNMRSIANIVVQIRTGFNMGIASSYFYCVYNFSNTGEYLPDSLQKNLSQQTK